MALRTDTSPWFKQGWPWLLIALPASAVIAGFFTLYLAIVSNDGMVVDDYYEEGKAINQVIHRDQRATSLNIEAALTLSGSNGLMNLKLNQIDSPHPDTLTIRFLHATRAGIDKELTMTRTLAGVYTSSIPVLEPGRWNLELSGDDWRVMSSLQAPGSSQVTFKADI